MDIADKITLLNSTTLESLNEATESAIVANFTNIGIKIFGADFGFSYWKENMDKTFELIYKSPNMDFQPRLPREHGYTSMSEKSRQPYMDLVKKEEASEYDFSPYMKSIIIMPIFYKDYQYGHIVLCFKNERQFTQEDRGLALALGNAAAQAITIHRLIASEQAAKMEAENQKLRFQALIENSYDVIALISQNGEILDISPSVTRISGHEPENLIGRNIAEFIYEKDSDLIQAHLQKVLSETQAVQTVEFRLQSRDGSLRWLETNVVNMLDNPAVGSIVANIREITDRKLAQETILHQALHDPLTHLPNRKEFNIRFNQALESAKRHNRKMALMFLDIDRFKNVNDALGHAVGDTLLKVAANRFTASVRAEDVVARLGGDEFLILLNEIHSNEEAVKSAEKILKATAIPMQIGEHTFHPTVSIGIAMYPDDGEDRENLKKHADIALYRAKANGRNGYSLYDPSSDTYAAEKFSLENQLRQAIELNQIQLYYQPIISLKTGKIMAVEALARWQHPAKGLILPANFIPLAEETGLIIPLSKYILNAACRQYKDWEALGFPKFRIAINLSAKSFSETEFISQLANTLDEYGMEPSSLEIEITESIAMSNLELTGQNLKQLKKMGVRITIDDFGTGYSSLSYLKSFPIHSLKIDRSFVRHCITNSQDAGIVRTIISMAQSLNLKVIGEGVETDQQLNFLSALGCNAAQGFYIAQPMPAEKLGEWLEEKKLKKKVEAALPV